MKNHPRTGASLRREVRPMTFTYEGESITVGMPGWYGDRGPDEAVFDSDDMVVPDLAMMVLRCRARIKAGLETE